MERSKNTYVYYCLNCFKRFLEYESKELEKLRTKFSDSTLANYQTYCQYNEQMNNDAKQQCFIKNYSFHQNKMKFVASFRTYNHILIRNGDVSYLDLCSSYYRFKSK